MYSAWKTYNVAAYILSQYEKSCIYIMIPTKLFLYVKLRIFSKD